MCWYAAASFSSGHGSRCVEKLSGPKDASCRSSNTTVQGAAADLVVYGATPTVEALCCDATLVSPLTRTGQPRSGSANRDGAVREVAPVPSGCFLNLHATMVMRAVSYISRRIYRLHRDILQHKFCVVVWQEMAGW